MIMDPKTKELVVILERLIFLLESNNEIHWSTWIAKSKSRIESSDFSGIELLLSAYGGMGSFNDLVICQLMNNGKVEVTNGYSEKNKELSILRSKAWELAESIKHEKA